MRRDQVASGKRSAGSFLPAVARQAEWRRAMWMRFAAINGFVAVTIGMAAGQPSLDPVIAEHMRVGAQMAFMHTMATFACSTFIQVGARRARAAPVFFLAGCAFFSGPHYLAAAGVHHALLLAPFGGASFLAGWAIIAWAAAEIDLPKS